ncbi:DHH family phosphoesterase [Mycoplasma sp. Mirounga ES2805-ORL]|uniref:DHH family phosphoesterase n=1 Tax=Mycoplasma sp. Mirounga ES2805-ORL TaxID=754514 RepID=UPI00197C6248|nr:DHH family phosphoesterase [Mycoplasma sp. Mirounga ES2805-ORL]QSF13582.1 DHH family phosphoesterase [Mycoplasma sp. Mirounga ES2805-ORL]
MNINKKKKFILYALIALLGVVIFITSIYGFINTKKTIFYALGTIGIIISLIITGFFAFSSLKSYHELQLSTKSSFNSFTDEMIADNLIGTLIYNNNNDIVYLSKFLEDRFGKKIIGQKTNHFFQMLDHKFEEGQLVFEIEYKGSVYQVKHWEDKNTFVFKDYTFEKNVVDLYNNELNVLAEMEIDNYQLYQSTLYEEQVFNLNKVVIETLDKLVSKYNFFYRQYNTNGKFFAITNKESLDLMIQDKFKFFNDIHNAIKKTSKTDKIFVSISAGFATGTKNLYKKMELAKNALLQAQSRGGDQVAIFSTNEPPRYFGSSREILPRIDRTRIKVIADLIEKKLSNKKIENVIVYGHANADLDAIGSALGVVAIAKKFNKNAYICSSTQDNTTKKAIAAWPELKNTFIKGTQASKLTSDKSLVFFVDNSNPKRTDNPDALINAKGENIFIIDHHRLGAPADFCPKINKIIDPSASSASELVTEIMIFMNSKIEVDQKTSQMLLNGIYLDTLQFQKHVTSKTFETASWLQARGADPAISTNSLKVDSDTYEKVTEILNEIQEIKPGFYLAYKDIPLGDDIISIAAEEILKIDGRVASFVVARQEKGDGYKLSARGLNTNVQLIAEAVGGGGHFGTAAATTKENLEDFIDNIKQAIVSVKNENNFN